MRTKRCPDCDETKTIDEFGLTPKRGKMYPHPYCRKCRSVRERNRLLKVREEKEWEETEYLAKRSPCFGCPKRNGCVEECWDYRKYLALG